MVTTDIPNKFILVLVTLASFLPAPVQGACAEKIVWSKRSPDKSLVFKNENGRVQILVCALRVVESKEPGKEAELRREFADCKPLDPDRKDYLESDLVADWNYVWKTQFNGRLLDAGKDSALVFAVTIVGTVLGQKIALGASKLGSLVTDKAKAASPRLEKASQCADKYAGFGQSFVEGSRLVGNDKFLRFFPAYIGLGAGLAWNAVNEYRHGDFRKGLSTANTLDPKQRGAGDGPCDPLDLGDKTVDEFADSLKKALTLADARPDGPKMRAQNADPRLRDALNKPPQGPVRP